MAAVASVLRPTEQVVLPEGMFQRAFSTKNYFHQTLAPFLEGQDLVRSSLVCKWWRDFATYSIKRRVEKAFFGKEDWETFFGPVGDVPELPPDYFQTLRSPCRLYPGKLKYETHSYVLMPGKVGDLAVAVATLNQMMAAPLKGKPMRYESRWEPFLKSATFREPISKPYWFLITNTLLPGTRNSSEKEQLKIANSSGYRRPRAIEVAVSIMCIFYKASKRLYWKPDTGLYKDLTMTRCHEFVDSCHVVIGKWIPIFPDDTILFFIHENRVDTASYGMGGVCRYGDA